MPGGTAVTSDNKPTKPAPEPKLPRRPVTREDFQRQLADQIGFLKASADSFDRGFEGEAKRLALTIRVLVHDTRSSRSLLGQLALRDQPFWDLSFPPEPGNEIAEGALVVLVLGTTSEPRYFAPLDDVPQPRRLEFGNWWRSEVFRHPDGSALTREELVLAAANQDGGGHVDPALDEIYARFAKDDALGWEYPDQRKGSTRIKGSTHAAIRQIAHEVLRTIEAGYAKQPAYPKDSVIAAGASMIKVGKTPPGSHLLNTASPYARTSTRILPNDPCPCGSGKKYKKCCRP